MIAAQTNVNRNTARLGWQAKFLEWLPRIERQLRRAFRHLDAEAHDEAVQEGIANCLKAFVRLHEQGRGDQAFASSLARFAIRHIRSGRQVGCRLNVRNPLSRYAQKNKGIRVERLDQYRRDTGGWVHAVVEDRRAPIPDQVAMRIDVSEWLRTLTRRARAIAEDLAVGCSTGDVARKYRVSPGRISQMRTELFDSWNRFQGVGVAASASGG